MDWESTKLGLPAKGGSYLITYKDPRAGRIIIKAYFVEDSEGLHFWSTLIDNFHLDCLTLEDDRVLAWKTFEQIEPYRGEE